MLHCCGYPLQFTALNFLLTAFANYGTWLAQIRTLVGACFEWAVGKVLISFAILGDASAG